MLNIYSQIKKCLMVILFNRCGEDGKLASMLTSVNSYFDLLISLIAKVVTSTIQLTKDNNLKSFAFLVCIFRQEKGIIHNINNINL